MTETPQTETPLDRDPSGQRPPGQRPHDIDPPEQRPPGQRPPWTETPPDRDPPGQRPPWQRPLDKDLPRMETPLDRDPPGWRPPWQRPPGWRPPGQRPPPPVSRILDTRFWKYYFAPTSLRAVHYMYITLGMKATLQKTRFEDCYISNSFTCSSNDGLGKRRASFHSRFLKGSNQIVLWEGESNYE